MQGISRPEQRNRHPHCSGSDNQGECASDPASYLQGPTAMAEGDSRNHAQDHGAHTACAEQVTGHRQRDGQTRAMCRKGEQAKRDKQIGEME